MRPTPTTPTPNFSITGGSSVLGLQLHTLLINHLFQFGYSGCGADCFRLSAGQNFTRTMNCNCLGNPVPVFGEALLSLLLLKFTVEVICPNPPGWLSARRFEAV